MVNAMNLAVEPMRPGDVVRLINGQTVYALTSKRAIFLGPGTTLITLATNLDPPMLTTRYFMTSSGCLCYVWDVSF